ncbi:EamA family transporter [Candidatus Kaiserbacteria bacterium]|nr:EamA family transporter [Candidatus Kaiserbacteria bacterium]
MSIEWWILIAALAQFINAVVAILDKYIVSDEQALPRPFVYAFYSCLITGFWVIIYFIGFLPGLSLFGVPKFSNVQSPTIEIVALSFLSAYTFFMALVSMYDGLKRSSASTVMPIIGAVSGVSAFVMNHLFLGVRLSENFIWGVLLLSVGTLLIAQSLPKRGEFVHIIHSGIFFALHYISMKGLFNATSFDDGFFWSRIGFVLFALSLLMVPAYWDKIKEQTTQTTKKTGVIVVMTKVLAGIAAFMLLKATAAGDVAVVQSTDGLKFVFIIIIATVFSAWIPESASEQESRPNQIIQKLLSIAVIVIGFFILFT